MSNPLISVIIPAYSHECYVQEAIRSVIDQTYPNIELIVIDDGSKDRTFQKIKEMAPECEKRFVRFLYQTQENQGTCITLNRLVALAKGKYIAWIASDDKYTPNALSDMFQIVEEDASIGLVVGKNFIMDSTGKQCYWDENRNIVYDKHIAKWTSFSECLMELTKTDFNSNKFGTYQKLLRSNHIPNGFLIRKNVLDKIGPFTREAPLEDHWMMLQIAKYAKMKYIDKPTFYYRWHATNTVKQNKKMVDMEKKTFEYEEKCVQNTKFEKTFYAVKYRKKTYLNFGFLKIYRQHDLNQKSKILELFGKKIILKRKKK